MIASSLDKCRAVFRGGNSTAEREEAIQGHCICQEAVYFIYPELPPPAPQATLENNPSGVWVSAMVPG